MLPKMAFTGFASRYREPTADEGFEDITKVNFKVRFSFPSWVGRSLGSARHGPPLAARSSIYGPSLTCHAIDSLTGPRCRRTSGASSGYRDQ
jgi:hypothetical protein